MLRAPAILLLLLSLLPAPVGAAAPAADCLTLEQAVRLALREDPDMREADARLMAARGARQRAAVVVPSNPELAATLATDRPFAGSGERELAIELTQEFFAPGQRQARIAMADAGFAAAEADRAWAARQVAADTAVAYVQTSAAIRKLADVESLLLLLGRLDASAARREGAGEISSFERNQVLLDTGMAQAELARVSEEASLARQSLELRTGLVLEPTALLMRLEPVSWPDVEALAAGASLAERPEIEAAMHRRESAESLLRVEKRERRPRPSLILGWRSDRGTVLGDDFRGLPFPADDISIRDRDEVLIIGFGLSIPIFDRNRGGITEAIAEGALADAALVRATRAARADVSRLLTQGRLLSRAHAAVADAPAAAATNLAVLERAADGGQLGLADILRERERIQRARLATEDVTTAYLETQLQLAAALGGLELFGIDLAALDRARVEEVAP